MTTNNIIYHDIKF